MEIGTDGIRRYIPCRNERNNPHVHWGNILRLSSLGGLDSENQSFLWKVLHDILPTQERLHRIHICSVPSPLCALCTECVSDSLSHALLSCSQNAEVSDWLLSCLRVYCPALTPEQAVLLDFGCLNTNTELPIVWLVAETFRIIWRYRL